MTNTSWFYGFTDPLPSDYQTSDWAILGLTHGASRKQIKKAYRQKCLETHPDTTGKNGDDFRTINEAYERLLR